MTWSRLGQVGRIVLITLLLMNVMAATMASLLWMEWVEQRSAAIGRVREETIAVATHVGEVLERTDLLLSVAADHLPVADHGPDHEDARGHGDPLGGIDHVTGRLPETGRLVLVDGDRRPRGLSSWPVNERLSPEIVALHAEAGQPFAISHSGSKLRPTLVVSRRIDRPEGDFGGVLAAIFDAEVILGSTIQPYTALTAASLLGGDGGKLVEWRRFIRSQESLPTPPPSNGSWVDVTMERVVASEPVPGFAARVVTSLPREPYLRLWWKLVARISAIFAVVTGLVAFGVLSVIREVASRTAAEANLKVANAELMRLMAEVEALARIDALTGVWNRRCFDERLASEMARAERSGDPLSLVMIDLDNFKRINDLHGHTIGDRVLATSAARLRQGVREVDFPARYGGEEFVILLPNTSLDGACSLAERLCAALDHPLHQLEDGTFMTVTASMGVTEYIPGENATEFIARADAALYQSKMNGRNRVSCASAQQPLATEQKVKA